MRIRVSAGGVSDSTGKPYPMAAIPDPEEWKQYKADEAVLAEAHESRIGRDGKLKIPSLRKGIPLQRGGASIELKDVDEAYVKLLRADKTLMVDVLPEPEKKAPKLAQE